MRAPRSVRGGCRSTPARRSFAMPYDGLRHTTRCRVHVAVFAALDEPRQPVDRVPDVDEAAVERREPEPDRVWRPEVRNHVCPLDQRAAEAPALVVAQGDVGATPGGLSRGVQTEALRRETLVVQSDCQLREGLRLRGEALDAGFESDLDTGLDGGQAENRRRAGEKALDPLGGLVRRAHRKLIALPEPAPDRRPELVLEVPADIDARRRARARVEVLVGAADC